MGYKFYGFLFCFLYTKPFWKGIHSKRKEFAPQGSKFFPFREDPLSEGDKDIFDRFVPCESVGILLKPSTTSFERLCFHLQVIKIYSGRNWNLSSRVDSGLNLSSICFPILYCAETSELREKTFRSDMCALRRSNQHSCSPIRVFVIRKKKVFILCSRKDAPIEDSDQTAQMRRLIWIFAEHTCPQIRFERCASNVLSLRLLSNM